MSGVTVAARPLQATGVIDYQRGQIVVLDRERWRKPVASATPCSGALPPHIGLAFGRLGAALHETRSSVARRDWPVTARDCMVALAAFPKEWALRKKLAKIGQFRARHRLVGRARLHCRNGEEDVGPARHHRK